MQGGTNVTRMDYVSPLNNELVFSMAAEKLLGIDGDIPERAVWMRMLLGELNRMAATCCSWPPTAWTSARSR